MHFINRYNHFCLFKFIIIIKKYSELMCTEKKLFKVKIKCINIKSFVKPILFDI